MLIKGFSWSVCVGDVAKKYGIKLFLQSDSENDIAQWVLLFSMALFPLSESDSDVTIAKFGVGSVSTLKRHQPVLCEIEITILINLAFCGM